MEKQSQKNIFMIERLVREQTGTSFRVAPRLARSRQPFPQLRSAAAATPGHLGRSSKCFHSTTNGSKGKGRNTAFCRESWQGAGLPLERVMRVSDYILHRQTGGANTRENRPRT